eukprot:CAMPEP_0117755478 /NCGR_PEP_ID=MMETSP0947-20121206/13477_1 /TAXON_ID=44440 /ORGANISM="Chattonella subsalsa, Strain CCMP2191" /LENGTH=72 /DNA_ID=CAMNT_0005574823 /DNA_START=236 /DNA_END=454 /DNA_ORIENTATION=-
MPTPAYDKSSRSLTQYSLEKTPQESYYGTVSEVARQVAEEPLDSYSLNTDTGKTKHSPSTMAKKITVILWKQ